MIAQPKTDLKLPSVFIVSSGRSGTTLLASMLNASEQIYIPYESDFIARAYPYYHEKDELTEDDYRHIVNIFKLSAKEDGWGMSEDYLLSQLLDYSPQKFSDVNAVICGAFHSKEKSEHLLWGIKAPVLIASVDRIHEVCPQAKIVHIVRDGRDVYLSYKKVHEESVIKFGPKSVVESALYWVDGLRRIKDFSTKNPNAQIYEIKYDSLLEEPELTLRGLCEFLDIEYSSAMHEDFNTCRRNQKVAPSNFKNSIHKKLGSGLDAKNTQKYLSAMSLADQMKFELLTIPYLLEYGYKPQYPILNSILVSPIRSCLYFLARRFNDKRYSKRDEKIFNQATQR